MKTIGLVILVLMLGGCAGDGIDLSKLESCGECLSGLQDLQTAQAMIPMMETAAQSMEVVK